MKVTRHRKANPLQHKIHMPDGIWTYRIGRKNYGGGATIRNPDCELTGKINMSELTGWSWSALERAMHKRTELPQVKPADIRKLIENIQKGMYEVKTTSKKAQVAQRQRRMTQTHVSEGSNPSLGSTKAPVGQGQSQGV